LSAAFITLSASFSVCPSCSISSDIVISGAAAILPTSQHLTKTTSGNQQVLKKEIKKIIEKSSSQGKVYKTRKKSTKKLLIERHSLQLFEPVCSVRVPTAGASATALSTAAKQHKRLKSDSKGSSTDLHWARDHRAFSEHNPAFGSHLKASIVVDRTPPCPSLVSTMATLPTMRCAACQHHAAHCGIGNKVVGGCRHHGSSRHIWNDVFPLSVCFFLLTLLGTCIHSESQGDGQVDTPMERTTSYRHAVDDPPRDEAEEEEEEEEEEEDGGAEPTRVRSQRKSMLPREWLCMIVVACMIVQGALVSWPPKLGSFQQQSVSQMAICAATASARKSCDNHTSAGTRALNHTHAHSICTSS